MRWGRRGPVAYDGLGAALSIRNFEGSGNSLPATFRHIGYRSGDLITVCV